MPKRIPACPRLQCAYLQKNAGGTSVRRLRMHTNAKKAMKRTRQATHPPFRHYSAGKTRAVCGIFCCCRKKLPAGRYVISKPLLSKTNTYPAQTFGKNAGSGRDLLKYSRDNGRCQVNNRIICLACRKICGKYLHAKKNTQEKKLHENGMQFHAKWRGVQYNSIVG